MEQARPPQTSRRDPMAGDDLLRQDDTRCAGLAAGRHEHPPGVPWPEDLLGLFSLRMARHGMSISRIHMLGNPGYALQQLAHARAMGDDTLGMLASQLFRFYESHQSGVHTAPH
jgi:hypothetical protein